MDIGDYLPGFLFTGTSETHKNADELSLLMSGNRQQQQLRQGSFFTLRAEKVTGREEGKEGGKKWGGEREREREREGGREGGREGEREREREREREIER